MYNILVILVCICSVYGAYALLREFIIAFARQKQIVAAVRVQEGLMDSLAIAEFYAQKHTYLESRVVLLCDADVPPDIVQYGLDVYVKLQGKEEPWTKSKL